MRNPNPKTILACKHFQEKNHNINIQNSILQAHLAAQKKPQRNSATTLNWKTKLLDPNTRHHIPKRSEPRTQ